MFLKPPLKCRIKKTLNKGWGVFATSLIEEGEIIEETPLIIICSKSNFVEILSDYRFNYPSGADEDTYTHQVLPAGFGSIYNHSENNNAYWQDHPIKPFVFQFITNRKILPGEEICTYYGSSFYWESYGRDKVTVVC